MMAKGTKQIQVSPYPEDTKININEEVTKSYECTTAREIKIDLGAQSEGVPEEIIYIEPNITVRKQ